MTSPVLDILNGIHNGTDATYAIHAMPSGFRVQLFSGVDRTLDGLASAEEAIALLNELVLKDYPNSMYARRIAKANNDSTSEAAPESTAFHVKSSFTDAQLKSLRARFLSAVKHLGPSPDPNILKIFWGWTLLGAEWGRAQPKQYKY